MSYDGQAPQPGGYPPQGPPQPNPQAPYPGQYAPQPGQYPPAQGYAPQPGQAAPQPGQYPAGAAYAPTGPQAPAVPKVNPFKGMPVSDVVRDGVAAFLLLISLALPVTDKGGIGSGFNFVVTIVTIVSVLSLALPYLARGGILPPTWTVHQTRLVRMLANAPYVVVVVLYVVFDIFKVGGRWAESTPGVGTAFALGLAGAILAAQPRESEMGPVNLDVAGPRLWRSVTMALAGFAALTSLVTLVFFIVNSGDIVDYVGFVYVLQGVIGILLLAGFMLWPAFGVLAQQLQSWRVFTMCLGAVVAFVMLFGMSSSSSIVQLVSVHAGGAGFTLTLAEGVGGIFFPAFAAAVAAPAFGRTLKPSTPQQSWIGVVVHALDFVVLVAGITALQSALMFGLKGGDKPTGTLVTMILLALVVAGGAVYARLIFAKSPANGKVFVLAEAGLALVLGIVILAVVPDGGFAAGHLILAFGLPLLLVAALFAPAEMRTYFRENLPTQRANPQSAFQWTPPPAAAPAGYQYPGQQAGPAPVASVQQAPAPQGYPAPGIQVPNVALPGQGPAASAYGVPAQPVPAESAPAQAAPVQAAPVQPTSPYDKPAAAPYGQPAVATPYGEPLAAAPYGQPVAPAVEPVAPTVAVPAAAPAAVAPVAPSQPVATAHGYTAEQALDPATSGLVLSQIVQEAPELRAQVAANPATYPALLDWLGQLNDPEVDAALRNRQG